MKSFRAPFTLLLPISSIALWIVLVALPVTVIYTQLIPRTSANGDVSLGPGGVSAHISDGHLFPFAARIALSRQDKLVEAINLPGLIVNVLISRLTSAWPDMWEPAGFSGHEWNAITFPFYCLPFWWFAGLGLEAARNRRHLRWPTLLAGTLLSVLMLTGFFGLTFALSHAERSGVTMFIWCLLLWALLLAAFPIAWVRSRRNLKPAH